VTATLLKQPGRVRILGLCVALGIAIAFAGCVSKAAAQKKERAAYIRGQQETMMKMQQAQMQGQGPCVTVNGEVRNRIVPWTEGMTLAKAIMAAGYYGATDPVQIIVVHNGIARRIQLHQLMSGVDIPLQPGDIVQLMEQSPTPPLQAPPIR
jgi:protein involved in polysaccharide export with SLBB domain